MTLAVERERVFDRSWVCVGRADQVPEPGDARPVDVAGEPLLLLRDREGRVVVVSRLCRHRGMELVSEPTSLRAITCPYHRWSYDLGGRLLGVPMATTDERAAIDAAGTCLPSFPVRIWQGFVLTCLADEPPPFDEDGALAATDAALAGHDLATWQTVASVDHGAHDVDWKLVVENAVENYHHIGTHRTSLERVAPARRHRVEPGGDGDLATVLWMPYLVDGDGRARDRGLPAAPGLSGEALTAGIVVAVHPTLLFSVSAELAFWFELEPLDGGRSRIRLHLVVPAATADDPEHQERFGKILADIEAIQAEDDRMYAGLHAGRAARHRGSDVLLDIEDGVRRFRRWYEQLVGGEA